MLQYSSIILSEVAIGPAGSRLGLELGLGLGLRLGSG